MAVGRRDKNMDNKIEKKYPRVGIGVMIMNDKQEVLLGLRQGSHGAGEWSFPGGHLEFGETILETAAREAKEECNLEVSDLGLISVADERRYIKTDGKHYLNIGILAKSFSGEVELMEPDKCREWRWFSLENLPADLLEGTSLIIRNYKANKIYQP